MRFLTIRQGRSDDGQLPYPLHATKDGLIGQQGLWRGQLYRAVGVQDAVDVQRVDTFWDAIWRNPEEAIGKFLVTTNDKGKAFGWLTPIETIEFADLDESFLEA